MNFRQFFATNRWWGKILGYCFGYLIASHIGALIGLLIGNFFDQGLYQHFNQPHSSFHDETNKRLQNTFCELSFLCMGYIAKSDGRVSENEIHAAKEIMQELNLSWSQKNMAKRLFNEGKKTSFNLVKTLMHLRSTCENNPALLKLFVDIQYRFAKVDGLSSEKLKIVNVILTHLGFQPLNQQYRYYQDFHTNPGSSTHQDQGSKNSMDPTLAQSYTLLNLNPNASKQEIKQAYRRLISQNHPDKLIAQGLSEQKIKIANEKTQKITKAYQYICSYKGW